MDHASRIARVQARLSESEVDGFLVTNLTNVRYLTGFSGTNGQVLISPRGAAFLTDPRYEARAAAMVSGADIAVYPARLTDVLADRLAALGIGRLGVEGASITLSERDDLAAGVSGIELVVTKDLVEAFRRTKDPEEVALIRAAIAIADEAFLWVLDRLVPGATEREVGLDLEFHMRGAGADDLAFPPIVGSGPLSAHIHHSPTDRAFEKGDLVLLDFGCRRDGYCSDLTRTVVLGSASDAQLELYDLVLRAQAAGIDAVGPGRRGADVDAIARKIVAEGGHAGHFGHGLGHGVGLDIHEAPRLHRISEDTLSVGDVVTVEPGVYIPEISGIRIEDCVLVTENGAEVLGSAPKDRLIEL